MTANWKNIAIGVLGIAAIGIAVFYYQTAKSKSDYPQGINPAFGEYITSFTSGVVNSGSYIRVILSAEIADSTMVGGQVGDVFDFSPGIEGMAVWIDSRTIEYRPSKRLKSGQTYEVEFELGKITEVPRELSTLQYSFMVIPQNFELLVENIKPVMVTDLKKQKIEGAIVTADFAEEDAVEKSFSAQQSGKMLTIVWEHSGEGKHHAFIVQDVTRGDAASVVNLAVSGSSLGIEQADNRDVEIPALGDFKAVNVKVDQGSSQFVVVQFSDPLAQKQNLAGLISISDIQSLDFEIKDNEVHIFPPVRQTGSKTLTIEAGIRNILNYKMTEGSTFDVTFEQVKPSVRFVGKGTILPSTDGLVMPFESVNLKAVDIQIVKVFETNVLQFLQVNSFDGNQEMRRVGKPLIKKMVSLENSGVGDLGKWNRFTLDLAQYINTEPGAIYQIQISFKKSYSVYGCTGEESDSGEEGLEEQEDWTQSDVESSSWDYAEEYYYDGDYNWEQRDNPCHSSYYRANRNIVRNVIASDYGITAKRGGDGTSVVFVNDLKTTLPLSGIQIEVYDYQQQVIGSGTTNSEGKAVIPSRFIPFAIVAKNGNQRGYLKLADGESLSLSNFDVGGERVEKGLKGMIYGERGVWRPGDSLYLTFLLEDKLKLLPASHPVVMELQNPQGVVVKRLVRSSSENGFYNFATSTSSDAPTGNWTARVKVGGTEFTQPIKIETIKPNRLKINLDFGKDKITVEDHNVSGTLNVKWLHGAPGRNLKAQFEVLLTPAETKFEKYPEYVFEDPAKEVSSEARPIYEGFTDDEGNAKVNATLDVSVYPPGMLNAVFRGKVFEESGNFSIDRFSLPFYPYRSFVGVRLPLGDKARGMLLTDTTHRVDIVTLDADGNGVSRDVEVELSKLEWRWWWDNAEGNANYMSSSNATPIASGTIKTVNGKGSWNFKVKYPEWGRFVVRARDVVSGHTSAKIVYIDWPGWAGRARNEGQGATMLSFSSDKPAYTIGEKVNLVIPGSDNGRALISVENGSHVVDTYWLQTQKGDNRFSFEVKPDMTPNIFVSVTLLQPHSQTLNDLPIRMYGVIPLSVEDPQTRLNPVISMDDVLEPGQEVTIKVSEKANRKMTYTVAVVEEGLLDITRFKTPNPWTRFYAREALGVKTWDAYDAVMGAFGGKIETLLAIGGDASAAKTKEDDAKANRFKPVVKFMGPFTLNSGTNEHKFIMPQYIGSVKAMIVAANEGAYGTTDKASPVRKPLMILATMPRVLGPEETIKLPITLFRMEKNIRNVKVDIKVSGPVTLTGESSREVTMDGDDVTTDFDLAVKSETGIAKIEFTASSGSYKATDVIEIEIRNPNPAVTRVADALLEPGKTWSGNVSPIGVVGTNTALLEVSTLPPINLGDRMKYLIQYPHGCIEQTTSSVFPQLYLDQVKALTPEEKARIQQNVRAGIERLKLFVTSDGGFAYWPGSQDSDSWGSTYAGHFLVEADARGYFVPNEMIKRWKKYQRAKSTEWRKNKEYQSSELIQAYRLYSLALAGDADMASMNRLREMGNMPPVSAWMLAAAYAKAGQPEAAKTLIAKLPVSVKAYQEQAYSYGSDIRDKAIILETLITLNDRVKGFELVKDISASLSNVNYWMSTQSVAWCLKAVGMFAGSEKKGPLKFTYAYNNGKEVPASTDLPFAQVDLPFDGLKAGNLKITSQSAGTLFVRIITSGTPARGEETEAANNLDLTVKYTNTDGSEIDPSNLEQGKEFIATVTIHNPGLRGNYKNMAINQIFPPGWEINNLRLDDTEDRLSGDKATYQDIRDDRVYTYFDISPAQYKRFQVMLTASYAGSYYLPALSCEAMYDRSVYARTKGQVVQVVKRQNQ